MTVRPGTTPSASPATHQTGSGGDRYKWIALSNTTIGMLMATVDSSIVLISLPAIFRGIGLNPLTSSNTSYLLWMLMGYMVVTAVLVVTFGRIGDMFGRVKMYNLGFAIFTAGSLAASLTYFGGQPAALYLIAMRIVQGVGGAIIMANSTAIITDAFPERERGMALGINSVAGIAGSFIGLVAGGLLAAVDWHLIFYVSVPIGLFGTVWAYLKLREVGTKDGGKLDWPGNLLFGIGLIAVLVGITYGLQPYGGSTMGWHSPVVLSFLIGGVALLIAFVVVESKVPEPMFDVRLFRMRAFAAGNIASLLSSVGRGGLMFMLIIWLQGIWLPLHGYSFESTPLWAGIYMLPLTGGFLVAGPISGRLSDRFGARPFATGGMIIAAVTFGLLMLLPANFNYLTFWPLLLANGMAMGLFAAPNTAGVMNAVPVNRRGAASGMRSTFQNAGMTLSIGLFFTIMVAGLSGSLGPALSHGLTAQGLSPAAAAKVASLPPVSVLFAAFLGYNPMKTLLGPALSGLSAAHQATITGPAFFSDLISAPFHHGLVIVFTFAGIMCLVAAAASWLRGSAALASAQAAELAAQSAVAEPAVAAANPAANGSTAPGTNGVTVPLQSTTTITAGNEAGTTAAVAGGALRQATPDRAPGTLPLVVTVSASFGAGGDQIARAVAAELGLPFIDRAIPGRIARELGLQATAHIEPDGHADSAVVRSLIDLIGVSFGISGIQDGPADGEREFKETTDAVLQTVAADTGGVILGRAGAVVLADRPNALHVRLDGPAAARAERVRASGLAEDSAWEQMRRTDHARTAYVRHLYGCDPTDPKLYHLVLDSTALSLDSCVAVITDAARGLADGQPAGARQLAATDR